MDEKEWLSGVDAEIQNHAEQDNPQSVPVPDFPALALFLAKSYGQMLKDRERLKAVIDAGVPIYTKEMALRDLASISIDYESERVQTSNISNIPLRITELLDNGYVEKMNRKLRREMDESVKEYEYLCWKIALVETTMRERMDKMERAIFISVNNGELVLSARSNCTTLPKQEYRLAGWLYRLQLHLADDENHLSGEVNHPSEWLIHSIFDCFS